MKRALLVDDDEVFCSHLAETFSGCAKDFTIVAARNGNEAAKIMADTRVDVIITDLNMPGMNGYEIISHVRACYPEIPILVMTGMKTPEVEEKLRTLGILRCIEKTFNVKEMVPLILDELRENRKDDFTKANTEFV